ncbi:hypothetical protein D3C84_415960 [compost metagenome]
MSDPATELADGLHFLRLEQGLPGLLQHLLRLRDVSDITGNLGKTEQGAGVTPDRIDDDVGEEPRTVLAHPPALVFKAPFTHGDVQRPLWLAGFAILRGIEDRKMLANDFFRQVTLDALGTKVPVAHASVRRKHVDRIVGHALHQQAELLLALLEDFLGHPAIGQVAGDLGEPQQGARRVEDRIDDHMGPEMAAVLAHLPAFALETPFTKRRVQCPLGQAGTTIVIGVETREMLTEDLGLLIPLEAPGAGIPAGNDAVRINHVDRIVDHRIDQ